MAAVVQTTACCRSCCAPIDNLPPILDLGCMAHAGGFLRSTAEFAAERRYPLRIRFCPVCYLVQVADVVPKETLFTDYFYASSSSATVVQHAASYAQTLSLLPSADAFVVEIGSNDGPLLRALADRNIRCLGVEPAANIATIARGFGCNVIQQFFNVDVAKRIVSDYGQATVLTSSNVMAHIDDIKEIMDAAKLLLTDDGVFVFEVHHLLQIVNESQYDIVYNEHVCYWSVLAAKRFLNKHGFAVYDAEKLPIHAGSIRIFASQTKRPETDRLQSIVAEETASGLDRVETFQSLAVRVADLRSKLRSELQSIVSAGKRIVGYGAAARANTLLNYCGIGPNVLACIADDSLIRQNTFTPGMHIPVVAPTAELFGSADVVLMLAWSFATEIGDRLRSRHNFFGRILVPLPSLQERYIPRNVLVTGGAGFIGSAVTNALVAGSTGSVVVVDRISYASRVANLDSSKPIVLVKADICDETAMLMTLKTYDIDTVLHFAAQTHVDNSYADAAPFIRDNIAGTQSLLQACHKHGKIKRFLHVSTDEVYGESPSGVRLTEDAPLKPTNPYAASKAAAELFVQSFVISYGLPVVVVRCNNVFGPGQFPDKLIPRFAVLAALDRKLTIHGTGSAKRTFVHTTDVVDAFLRVLNRGLTGETYNVGGIHEYDVSQIAGMISAYFGRSANLLYGQDRVFNDRRYSIDASKITALGWRERSIDFRSALADTIRWYADRIDEYKTAL